jgi:hypothetical protein
MVRCGTEHRFRIRFRGEVDRFIRRLEWRSTRPGPVFDRRILHRYRSAVHANFADQNQVVHFLKNIAMTGGLLQIVAFGAGGFSLEARARRQAATKTP